MSGAVTRRATACPRLAGSRAVFRSTQLRQLSPGHPLSRRRLRRCLAQVRPVPEDCGGDLRAATFEDPGRTVTAIAPRLRARLVPSHGARLRCA